MDSTIQSFANDITEYLFKHKISCDLEDFGLYTSPFADSGFYVSILIEWGDWKHEHCRADRLVEEKFKPYSTKLEVTEEDGSDTFSAIHRYEFDADVINLKSATFEHKAGKYLFNDR